MLRSIYVTASGRRCGKNAVALGMTKLLFTQTNDVAVFRPIIGNPEGDKKDPDVMLLNERFKLRQTYEESYAFTADEATAFINKESRQTFIERVISKYKQLEEKYEFVVCIGSDFLFSDPVFEFDLNAEIAGAIGSPVVLVVDGRKKLPEIRQSIQSSYLLMPGCEILATIINIASLSYSELESLRRGFGGVQKEVCMYAIPASEDLANPTMRDLALGLNAKILADAGNIDVPVKKPIIAAMHPGNFLRYLTEGALVITPGDRPDILFATLAAKLSTNKPSAAGILLTGGIEPEPEVVDVLQHIPGCSLPILSTEEQTIAAVNSLTKLHTRITANDERKVTIALNLFEHYVDGPALLAKISQSSSEKVSALMFEHSLVEKAKSHKQRIVLCEGEEERIILAASALLRREAVDLILLGNKTAIELKAGALQVDISQASIVEPSTSPKYKEYAEAYCEYRKAKGMDMERALNTMLDPTYFGTMMVKQGDADGMVSGAINTTAHTIRPAFEFIKTRPGSSIVSSVFLMCLQNRVLVFGDCAVNPNPTAPQLAEIALASARTAKIFGIEPKVAMLSYSTGDSGKGADVDIVIEATKIAKEQAPDLLIEGPIQYDAAVSRDVARTKLPNSKVAGQATVFIFPDLNTGNNTYKAVQRAANAVAIGPVLQGLKKPVNDLSRGCLVPDIVNTVVITALQAAAEKGEI